jgi:hypothetical protein
MTQAAREDVIAIAIELIDELSTELDLYYENAELAEMGSVIDKLRKLQTLTGREPETEGVLAHILGRFEDAKAEK